MANTKPEKKFQRGPCSVSIFNNEVAKNGRTIEIRKAVFQKRYKDNGGAWQTTTALDMNDIPKAKLCLDEAYEYLTHGQSQE